MSFLYLVTRTFVSFLFHFYIHSHFSVTRACATYYTSIALNEFSVATCLPQKSKRITTRRQTISTFHNISNELEVDFDDENDGSDPQQGDQQSVKSPLLTNASTSLSQQSPQLQNNKKLQIFNSFNPFETISKAPFILRNKRVASI